MLHPIPATGSFPNPPPPARLSQAFVVLRPGEEGTAEEIIAFTRDHQAGYRVPGRVEFRNSLPETLVGKVLRRVLLEEEKRGVSSEA